MSQQFNGAGSLPHVAPGAVPGASCQAPATGGMGHASRSENRQYPAVERAQIEPMVSLRPWNAADAELLRELFDDPLVYRFTPIAEPFDIAAAAKRIAVLRSGEERGLMCGRGVVASGSVVGEVAAYSRGRDQDDGPIVTVSYVIGAQYRGRGIARAALASFVDELSLLWGVRRFVAEVSPENPASEEVARSAGFIRDEAAQPVERPGKGYSVLPWVLTRTG